MIIKFNCFGWIVSALCLILMLSCHKEAEVSPSADPSPQEMTNVVSYDEALAEVKSILGVLDVPTRGKTTQRTIASSYTLGGSSTWTRTSEGADSMATEPLVYVFNFENEEGFALISGDRRTTPVLAITESGSLNPDEPVDNPGLALFLSLAEDYMVSTMAATLPEKFKKPDPEEPGDPVYEYRSGPWTIAALFGTPIAAECGARG